jgi:hypothetical protein
MKPALRDFKALLVSLARHAVDEAVLISDAARPKSSKILAQRLWFAGAFEGVPSALFDQFVEAKKKLWLLALIPEIVLPRAGREDDLHC